ncbi:S41 family peptidase [Sphingomonas sp. LaA6.9]|uniref:S41 family peptidase n=1 Tax=Sphingomonas sp. LaA6.9 TaxID=2919914 RepID=UPI001F4FFD27|nr:S41 family peptidase [Sphingomonas sp. LaA6.9]MCJ8156832.1 S41 family peptidase [Sphingomonas sp. LaA6.9]
MPKPMIRAALALSAVALVPATTASMAAVDATTWRELDQFLAVFERVRADYVEKVDDEALIKGAIDGMLSSLDPHSSYLDARDFENMRTQTDGAYGGLGLTVSMEDGAVKVITPTEDTPAYKAGIKAGDYITHLDGTLIYGGTLDEAVDQMRGKPGTSIKLTIVRPGRDKPFDVTLTREIIELKPVKWEVKNKVGIININSFSRTTAESVRAAIVGVEKSLGAKPLGYVIDLRSNPGGLLDQAVEVSDVFLERGEVVSQRGRQKGDIERFYARPGDMAKGLPIVVLVDSGSASAAEIVAGAIQDHHRGVVMGERSFGKGSVQTLLPLTDTTALRLTTARYYTPSGRSVQEGGIEPDIQVPQLSDPDYKTRPRFREADLKRHLINEAKVDNSVLEEDAKDDPRFKMTAEELKKKGVEDFQLTYAIDSITRLNKPLTVAAARPTPKR